MFSHMRLRILVENQETEDIDKHEVNTDQVIVKLELDDEAIKGN